MPDKYYVDDATRRLDQLTAQVIEANQSPADPANAIAPLLEGWEDGDPRPTLPGYRPEEVDLLLLYASIGRLYALDRIANIPTDQLPDHRDDE